MVSQSRTILKLRMWMPMRCDKSDPRESKEEWGRMPQRVSRTIGEHGLCDKEPNKESWSKTFATERANVTERDA